MGLSPSHLFPPFHCHPPPPTCLLPLLLFTFSPPLPPPSPLPSPPPPPPLPPTCFLLSTATLPLPPVYSLYCYSPSPLLFPLLLLFLPFLLFISCLSPSHILPYFPLSPPLPKSWVFFWYLATYFWTFFFAVDVYNSKHGGKWYVHHQHVCIYRDYGYDIIH